MCRSSLPVRTEVTGLDSVADRRNVHADGAVTEGSHERSTWVASPKSHLFRRPLDAKLAKHIQLQVGDTAEDAAIGRYIHL